jgi:hypothetical protein
MLLMSELHLIHLLFMKLSTSLISTFPSHYASPPHPFPELQTLIIFLDVRNPIIILFLAVSNSSSTDFSSTLIGMAQYLFASTMSSRTNAHLQETPLCGLFLICRRKNTHCYIFGPIGYIIIGSLLTLSHMAFKELSQACQGDNKPPLE